MKAFKLVYSSAPLLRANTCHRPTVKLCVLKCYHTRLLQVRQCTPASTAWNAPVFARHLSSSKKSESNEDIVGARENIYTLPNALTMSRILSCPFLACSILHGNFELATGILIYAGVSDWVDGFLARRFKMKSVLGTVLDPAADKALMTTLTVTLTMKGLLPVPLAVVILGRDVLLSLSAFYIRYKTLPAPKSFTRYWDFSIPSAEVHPTGISKINTALQLLLMGVTTISPLLSADIGLALQGLQWTVAGTTVWSGFSYLFSNDAVRVLPLRPRAKR